MKFNKIYCMLIKTHLDASWFEEMNKSTSKNCSSWIRSSVSGKNVTNKSHTKRCVVLNQTNIIICSLFFHFYVIFIWLFWFLFWWIQIYIAENYCFHFQCKIIVQKIYDFNCKRCQVYESETFQKKKTN